MKFSCVWTAQEYHKCDIGEWGCVWLHFSYRLLLLRCYVATTDPRWVFALRFLHRGYQFFQRFSAQLAFFQPFIAFRHNRDILVQPCLIIVFIYENNNFVIFEKKYNFWISTCEFNNIYIYFFFERFNDFCYCMQFVHLVESVGELKIKFISILFHSENISIIFLIIFMCRWRYRLLKKNIDLNIIYQWSRI